VPFSVYEWLICAAVTVILALGIRQIVRIVKTKQARRLLLNALTACSLTAAGLACAFTWLWGLNYAAPPLKDELNLPVKPRDAAFLTLVAQDLADKASEWAPLVPRSENSVTQYLGVKTLGARAVAAYDTLAQNDRRYAGASPPVKRLTFDFLFSKLGIYGIYFPFTGEANVNPDSPAATLPFTVAHETAHRLGFAREEEANFVAFLACRASDDPLLQYSGYLEAMFYCLNRLEGDNRNAVTDKLNDLVRADWHAIYLHYQKNDGVLREVSAQANNSYLQIMGQQEGEKSYGLVVDLILAEYAVMWGVD